MFTAPSPSALPEAGQGARRIREDHRGLGSHRVSRHSPARAEPGWKATSRRDISSRPPSSDAQAGGEPRRRRPQEAGSELKVSPEPSKSVGAAVATSGTPQLASVAWPAGPPAIRTSERRGRGSRPRGSRARDRRLPRRRTAHHVAFPVAIAVPPRAPVPACHSQSGSSASGSPVAAHARAREPPHTARNVHTPHWPPNPSGARRARNNGEA
jgi:hypothetical protein